MKYKPSRDIPKFAREYKTLSAKKLAEIILRERNKDVKPHSITVWLDRHEDVKAAIESEIHAEELPATEVSPTIFLNGTFEQLISVTNWTEEMIDRKLDRKTIGGRLSALKRVCRGHGLNDVALKHPDRLTLNETRDYIRATNANSTLRVALRDFLLSKGITVGKKISGATTKGKYSKLYVQPKLCREILADIKKLSFEVYAVDLFEVKNATRISAVLNSRIENISWSENIITVYDKGRRSIHPEGKQWDKHLDAELANALRHVIGGRVEGKIFKAKVEAVRDTNHTVLREQIKRFQFLAKTAHDKEDARKFNKIVLVLKLCDKIPTHWLRHEFFQHCLHETNWKYGVCAALGGSTVSSLEESYGQPPKAIVKKWGEEWLDKITV